MTAKQLRDHTVMTRADDNGTSVAYVPAIDGCHAWGRTPAEAQSQLAHVFQMIAEEFQEAGRLLPPDVELAVSSAG